MANGDRIAGTGIDLVENARVQEMIEKWGARFRDRVFCPAEQAYCEQKRQPWPHYAGRFAVKEAVAKAFSTGIGKHVNWLDIEITRCPQSGAPSVVLSGPAADLAVARGVREVKISLSHTRHYAVAQAILLADPDDPTDPNTAAGELL
jgi:holo-[acyl-carrier protein] synthase